MDKLDFTILLSSRPYEEEMLVQPHNERARQWLIDTVRPDEWWWIDKNNLVMESEDYDRLIQEITNSNLTFVRKQ